MKNSPMLLWAGILLFVIGTGFFGYVWLNERATRERIDVPEGTNIGFAPVDLLLGRTRFEKLRDGQVVFSLDEGPNGEARVTLARAALAISAVGIAAGGMSFVWRKRAS